MRGLSYSNVPYTSNMEIVTRRSHNGRLCGCHIPALSTPCVYDLKGKGYLLNMDSLCISV